MRTTILLIIFNTLIFTSVYGQDVKDIRVERSGDLITVHYKIDGSTSNQLFRVSVLCSIDGGLKVQPRSITGDIGNNITGGRQDYTIIWDVLKDVDVINTAEFFITAELTRDLSVISNLPTKKSSIKGKVLVMIPLMIPGPKSGICLGYAGSFGFQIELSYGRVPVLKQYMEPWSSDRSNYFCIGLGATKRIINTKNFQAHLLGGYRSSDLYLVYTGSFDPVRWRQGGDGVEAGLTLMAGKRLVFSAIYSQLKLRRSEPETYLISPSNYAVVSAGFRF